MNSAASDWQNVSFLSDHSLLFGAVNTVIHLIYRFFYSFAIKYLNWNSFYNDYALSLQQNNFLTECGKAEAFRELVGLQGRMRPLWCSLVSWVWGHFCLCREWETAGKTGEIMNLPRRCTFWLKSLGIKTALQQSQHPSPSLLSWQLEDMPGRSLMLHFHAVQLLPSFSDTQSIHNIHISILFPHSEIPSYHIYSASSLLCFWSVCWIEFQFLLTFKNLQHFEPIFPFLDFTSFLSPGLL